MIRAYFKRNIYPQISQVSQIKLKICVICVICGWYLVWAKNE